MKKNRYSFFCPAYYDEKNVTKVVEKAVALFSEIAEDYEILIINDGSPDGTAEVAEGLAEKYEKVKVMHHEHNLGYGATLRDGIKYANKFEYVCFTDGDNQYDVNDFRKMIPLLSEYDMIIGIRKINANNIVRKIVSKIYNITIRVLFGVKYRDLGCSLRIAKKEVLEKIKVNCSGPFAPGEIIIKLDKLKYKICEFPISSYPRYFGKSTSLIPKNFLKTLEEIVKVRHDMFRNRY